MSPRVAGPLLALNLGSTSLKGALFDTASAAPRPLARATVDVEHPPGDWPDADADAALKALWQGLAANCGAAADLAPACVVHRIVHGGDLRGAQPLDARTSGVLERLAPLAPMHQRPALVLARRATGRWPQARALATFDTDWHADMPEVHAALPLPPQYGARRYGFHGLAFASAMRQLGEAHPDLAGARVVLAHLGGGSSLCAVQDGRAVATTMGMTPLGGVPMGRRSGSLDPGVLFHLHRSAGLDWDAVEHLLWTGSGLRGVSGTTGDVRALLASPAPRARLALDLYVTAVAQAVAAMATCIGGVDAVVFSGGVGAGSPEIRARIAAALGWIGVVLDPARTCADPAPAACREIGAEGAGVRSFVAQVDEEAEMARMALASAA